MSLMRLMKRSSIRPRSPTSPSSWAGAGLARAVAAKRQKHRRTV